MGYETIDNKLVYMHHDEVRTGKMSWPINNNAKDSFIVFIVSYYRQLSEDVKIKNDKIKTSFVSPKFLKTGINFI